MEKNFTEVEKKNEANEKENVVKLKFKFKNDAGGEFSTFSANFEEGPQGKTFDSTVGVVDAETTQKINCTKRPEQNIDDMANRRRPKSAGCLRNVSPLLLSNMKKRPRSCCSLLKDRTEQKEEMKGSSKKVKRGKRLFQIKSFNEPDNRNFYQTSMDSSFCCCSRACSSRDSHYSRSCEMFDFHHRHKMHCFCEPLPGHLPKCYCHNITSFSTDKTKKFSQIIDDTNLWKYKRSLKLLGFQPSDFGIQSRVKSGKCTARKCRSHSTLPTKIFTRSYSLDCLRETIKGAWMEDRMDIFHRKILAQAAYEEWYLMKEKELLKRREEKKLKEVENKENLEKNLKTKEEKAKQEFRKWVQRKKIKLKAKSEFPKTATIENKFTRRKTPEETESAFLKWKKEKDLKLLNSNKEKKKAEEMKTEMEKQKQEQKVLAEKAYQQWKAKMEEKLRLDTKKKLKRKELEESESQKKLIREKESQSSFQIWKAIKDQQLQKRIQHNKVVARLEEEKRQAMLEERMYEADQAFEDWLNKIDLRYYKQYCKTKIQCNKLPWLPP